MGILEDSKYFIFSYAFPAYECFKIVEKNKPEIEQLLLWSKYWILVAVITVLERIGDVFLCWLPFYSEAKLALFLYLWSLFTLHLIIHRN